MRLSGCSCELGAVSPYDLLAQRAAALVRQSVDAQTLTPVSTPTPTPTPATPVLTIDEPVKTNAPPPLVASRESYIPTVQATKTDAQSYVIEPVSASSGAPPPVVEATTAPEEAPAPTETPWLLWLAIGVAIYKFAL